MDPYLILSNSGYSDDEIGDLSLIDMLEPILQEIDVIVDEHRDTKETK